MRKRNLFILIAVIVVIVLVSVLGSIKRKPAEKFTAIIVKKDNIVSKVQADGSLEALNQIEIGSDVIGKIVQMLVNEGDKVEKGDILCVIDQSTYTSQVNQALAGLDLAKSQLTQATTDLDRTTELFKNQLISKEDFESAKLKYETARSNLKTSEEAYNEAKATLEKTVIKSPIAGEVIQCNKKEGEMVDASTMYASGVAIMVLGDRSRMFVKALVDETEIVKIAIGQQANVSIDAFPDTVFTGKVVRIEGIPNNTGTTSTTNESINFPIKLEMLPVGGEIKLYPGMSASCEILTDEKDSVVVIPYNALGRQQIKDKEEDVAILSKGGKAKITPVKLGIIGEKGVEIKNGINVGDTVLTGPYKKLRELKDGNKVEIEKSFKANKNKSMKITVGIGK